MRMIFVNLPVKDLPRSRAFFAALGFDFNPAFSNEQAAFMIVEENIGVMLLAEPFFQTFVTGRIADPRAATGAILCLSAESREAVNAFVDKALAAGAGEWKPPQDHGFMYGRSFQDLDGHVWEVMWMDMPGVSVA